MLPLRFMAAFDVSKATNGITLSVTSQRVYKRRNGTLCVRFTRRHSQQSWTTVYDSRNRENRRKWETISDVKWTLVVWRFTWEAYTAYPVCVDGLLPCPTRPARATLSIPCSADTSTPSLFTIETILWTERNFIRNWIESAIWITVSTQ